MSRGARGRECLSHHVSLRFRPTANVGKALARAGPAVLPIDPHPFGWSRAAAALSRARLANRRGRGGAAQGRAAARHEPGRCGPHISWGRVSLLRMGPVSLWTMVCGWAGGGHHGCQGLSPAVCGRRLGSAGRRRSCLCARAGLCNAKARSAPFLLSCETVRFVKAPMRGVDIKGNLVLPS